MAKGKMGGIGGGKLGMSGGGYDVKMPTGNGKGKAPAQMATKVKPKKKR